MALKSTGLFTEMEIDFIGEIQNISMGSAATTLSEILDRKVSITTPKVEILHASKIRTREYEPAIGIEISYDKGILGKNVMIFKIVDAKKILQLLLGIEMDEQDTEIDEMTSGAMAEIMNQMMGASATSLSTLLEREISITPPHTFPVAGEIQLRKQYFHEEDDAVVTTFHLTVEDVVDSDFMAMMKIDLARELISAFSFVQGETQEEAPPPPPPTAPAWGDDNWGSSRPERREPAVHEVRPVQYQSFDTESAAAGKKPNNLGLIMSVPLEIKVEIGQTKKTVREVLDFIPGMVLELNKQVGTPVDVYVNGRPIAKGDVVVVDDHYGVRITEILSARDLMDQLV